MKLKLPKFPKLPTRPREKNPRRERKVRVVTLVVLTAVAVVLTPVARPLGYSLAGGLCSGEGCSDSVGDVPSCSGVGRDKAISATLNSYSTALNAEAPTQLMGFVNGEVKVVTEPQPNYLETFQFSDVNQAKRFVFDNSRTLPRTIDSGSGPTASGTYRGFTKVLAGMGLIAKDSFEPRLTGGRFDIDDGFQGVSVKSAQTGQTYQTTLIELPRQDTPSLNRLAAVLGITGVLRVESRIAPDGQPLSMVLSGPGAESWSINVLRTAGFGSSELDTSIKRVDGGFLVRSYYLDLKSASNTQAFEQLTERKSVDGLTVNALRTGKFDLAVAKGEELTNPYSFVRDRIRDVAVVAETKMGTAADITTESIREVFSTHSLMKQPVSGIESTEINAADLVLPGSTFQPFATCKKDS